MVLAPIRLAMKRSRSGLIVRLFYSSEFQIVTAKLIDGPAAHRFMSRSISARRFPSALFNASLTSGRQSMQIKSSS
jgi:hypothetical protein